MFNKRVQRRGGSIIGERRILWWWITVREFTHMSDAVKWLGYDDY